jgi:uncharacterized protein (TIGR02145 family)
LRFHLIIGIITKQFNIKATRTAKKETKYYSWVAAMNGESKEGAQGICAKGWHIPTDDDVIGSMS